GAVQQIGSPSLNLVYADKMGNIGHYVTGRAPIRRTGKGQVPVPGWTGKHEWIGDVPFSDMPHALNPATGYLVNANNKIVDDTYPFFLGSAWRNGYRARRITEFIEGHPSAGLSEMRQLQHDVVSIPGLKLRDFLQAHFAEDVVEDAELQDCLELLRNWDGMMSPASAGALIYKTLVVELSMAIILPKVGQQLANSFLGTGPHPVLYPFGESHGQWLPVLLRLLQAEESWWLTQGDMKNLMLRKAVAQTMRRLRAQFGDDPDHWSWAANHKITFGHTLATQRPLDLVFNTGGLTVGGDADTVCQMSIDQDNPANNIAPSYRQILDVSNWDVSLAVHAPGQSGHLASRHYADLCEPWREGGYFNLCWSKRAVSLSTRYELQLLPWPVASYGAEL
ncbi:MAG: penicillin acylase family protein, partial [Chloroflexota bacterium]